MGDLETYSSSSCGSSSNKEHSSTYYHSNSPKTSVSRDNVELPDVSCKSSPDSCQYFRDLELVFKTHTPLISYEQYCNDVDLVMKTCNRIPRSCKYTSFCNANSETGIRKHDTEVLQKVNGQSSSSRQRSSGKQANLSTYCNDSGQSLMSRDKIELRFDKNKANPVSHQYFRDFELVYRAHTPLISFEQYCKDIDLVMKAFQNSQPTPYEFLSFYKEKSAARQNGLSENRDETSEAFQFSFQDFKSNPQKSVPRSDIKHQVAKAPDLPSNSEFSMVPGKRIEFSCPVCLREYVEIISEGSCVVSNKCGHMLCESCSSQVTQLDGNCPTCRTRLQSEDIRKLYF